MPTVFRHGPYRFFFYSADGVEPPHIHCERDRFEAKFWLEPPRLASSHGFNAGELSTIISIVADREQFILDFWNDYFGD